MFYSARKQIRKDRLKQLTNPLAQAELMLEIRSPGYELVISWLCRYDSCTKSEQGHLMYSFSSNYIYKYKLLELST